MSVSVSVIRWKKEDLDLVLVPSGLLIMLGYHIFLLYRIRRCPQTTALGHEKHCRSEWIDRVMQVECKDRGQAVTVISTNISAATSLSSTALVLSSVIGAWIGTSAQNVFTSQLVYGDTSKTVISIKYMTLLCCFMVAFGCFVQTARCYVHATFLITMPDTDIPVTFVQQAVITGGNFWSVGIRALYFAITFLLWVFGPIPMFLGSVIMVVMLHNLDSESSPLHLFQPPKCRDVLVKIGQEMTAVVTQEINAVSKAIGHHGRPTRTSVEQ